MRLISNSEASTWLECRRKYYYAYILDLEPLQESEPITKGTLIHAMLEGYYVAKSSGYDESECIEFAMEPLMAAAQKPYSDIADLGETRELVLGYFAHYRDEDEKYRIIAVETQMKSDLDSTFALAGTVDVIFQDMTDGKYIIVDHKSSYNFWSDSQANISGQFPKYIFMARDAGMEVKGAIINQIRTRKMKEGNELYRRTWVKPNEDKIRAVMAQHIQVSHEIMAYREHNTFEATVPRFDKYACANCTFLDLCDSQSSGAPVKYMIASDFRKREGYGYNHREVPE